MKSVNSGMTKRVLTAALANDYGIEAPSKATKADLLNLLKEAGCPVTPEPESAKEVESVEDSAPEAAKEAPAKSEKEPRYVINIFKEKGNKGAVTGCINGKAFVLPRGKDIEISKAIYEILTLGAVKQVGEALDGGGVEMYSQSAYPLTLVKVIK